MSRFFKLSQDDYEGEDDVDDEGKETGYQLLHIL